MAKSNQQPNTYKYLIKIDYSKLNKKQSSEFEKLFNDKKFKRFVVANKNSTVILHVPLFDYLSFEIDKSKHLQKQARFSLYRQLTGSKKVTPIINDAKYQSEDYDKLLQTIYYKTV